MPVARDISSGEIAEIAHELRSPLGGIEAMVEMLEASRLDAEQRRMIAALKASVTHLRGIADGVLGAEKAKVSSADCTWIVLGELLGEIEFACLARAQTKGLSFSLTVETAGIAEALVECGPLRQVLENLVDNAVRLTPVGLVELRVIRKPGGRLGFEVHDGGPGISSDEAARLIRSGGSIEGRAGGAGIGLSIAGRLVAERGGMLTGGPVEAGAGAVFTFDWPDQRVSEKGDCLIVDDHPASRLVLGTILRSAGYGCLEAASVGEAMRVIAMRQPAFVLTDLNMPGEGGEILIQRIAELPEGERPRLVVVSADDLDAANPLHAAVDRAIRKPITVRAVLEAMADFSRETDVRAA